MISFFAIAITYYAKSEEHMKYSVLAIEYVGESDKPITPIVISDSKEGAEWCRTAVLKRNELELTSVHVVTVSLMGKLIEDAELYLGIAEQELGKHPKSATVSVTLITPQRRRTFLLNTKLAVSLLDSFRKRCNDDKPLCSDLSHFQNRILP